MNKIKKKNILKALKDILGEDGVSGNPAVCSSYRLFEGKAPQFVTMPKTTEQVQEIVRLANKEKLTLLPISIGTKAISREADILLDMMQMNKIITVDPENSFVLVEAGVTFNQLDVELEKVGYTIARGTFPSSFSVVGNLAVTRSFNNNFSGRICNQTLGLEAVLLDGEMVRTGVATFGNDFWSTINMDVPDYRGLFFRYDQNNPPLGITTKAAIRIWPKLEAQGFPIGGFDTFEGAVRFCKAVTKAGIADQSMAWSWVVMGLPESKTPGSKIELDFLNHRMTNDFDTPYPGMHYCYTWTQFRGYKEQVDVNLKICERLAKEHGGRILSEKELNDTIPNTYAVLKSHYKDFHFSGEKDGAPMLLWMHGGESLGETCYYYGWTEDLIKLEGAYNKRLIEKYKGSPQPYYMRIMEGGVGAHLRYIPLLDLCDPDETKAHFQRSAELHSWVKKKFPNIHCPMGNQNVDTDSIGMGAIIQKLRKTLDPNQVGFVPGDKRLEADKED